MRPRVILLALALACVWGGASCTEADAPAATAASPGPAPPFSYSLYIGSKGFKPGADRVLAQRPEHLEYVYANRNGPAEARALFRWLEGQFQEAGSQFANITALACTLDLPIRCTPDWEFIDEVLGHGDGPGAMRLRQVLADSFSAQARQRGMENTVVLAIANAVMTRGMVKTAVGKAAVAAEARAAAGSVPRGGVRGATAKARPLPAASEQAAAAGAERLVAATGRLRAPRDLSAIQARLVEAEALETGARQTAVVPDLAKLRPLSERPPSGVGTGEALWRDYVIYWERRFAELSGPDARATGIRPPLTWESYRAFHSRFARALKFQSDVSAMLRGEAEKPQGKRQLLHEFARPQLDENVGLAHEGSDARTYVDQLAVDEATLESDAPRVETFSTKQRDFTRMNKNAIATQVQADAREAMAKYGGPVEVRRQGHPLFERHIQISQVHLIYDEAMVPELSNLRQSMADTARASGVDLHFLHAP
jgi:hypothetical protein